MAFDSMAQASTINIELHAQTDIGMVRHGNEDNFLVVDLSTAETWTAENSNAPPKRLIAYPQGRNGSVIAVSDGMGGALAGEVASQMAVSSVRDRMLQFQATQHFAQFAFHERLRLAIEQANLQINSESQSNVEYTGMGATFTAAGIEGDVAYLAQVGDSRCYLVRQGKIVQVTKDQSLVSQLVEAGHITEEEAEQHTYKNVILQALGAQPRVNVIVDRVTLRRGDTLLLCSDGLSGKVKGPEMLKIIVDSPDIKTACDALIKLANDRGGEDNITVLIARVHGDGLKDSSPEDPLKGEFLPRDPSLPDEIDNSQLVQIDEETLRPEDQPTRERRERVDIVETQEVQATMLNMPAVTPQMLAAAQAQMEEEAAAEPVTAPLAASTAAATAAPAVAPSPSSQPIIEPVKAASRPAPPPPQSMASEESAQPTSSGSGSGLIIVVFLIVLIIAAILGWNFIFKPKEGGSGTTTNSPESTQTSQTVANATEQLNKVSQKLDTLNHDAQGLQNSPVKDAIVNNLKQISNTFESLKQNLNNGLLKPEDIVSRAQELSNQLNPIEQQLKDAAKTGEATPKPDASTSPQPDGKKSGK